MSGCQRGCWRACESAGEVSNNRGGRGFEGSAAIPGHSHKNVTIHFIQTYGSKVCFFSE